MVQDSQSPSESNQATSFLKFMGPYPALPLHFPSLSTSNQRAQNETGISLDFIVDTAANTNTINAQVAQELALESVGSALPGYGAAGAIEGGETFSLGDCTFDRAGKRPQLQNNEDDDSSEDLDLFMTNLTASALPIASPAAAGLLGVAFLNCFEGGVKFDWGGGIDARQPMITFYGAASDDDGDGDNGNGRGIEERLKTMRRVPIHVLDDILLPSITMIINGAEIRALLDTGSPITVLNAAAAKVAGLTTIELETDRKGDGEESERKGGFQNPFKKFGDNFKAAQVQAEAASRGDILVIGGMDGQRIELRRTNEKVSVSMDATDVEGEDNGDQVTFPSSYIYVGDLPGLVALDGLKGSSSPPAAILGMDVLKRLPAMVYRQNEVYF